MFRRFLGNTSSLIVHADITATKHSVKGQTTSRSGQVRQRLDRVLDRRTDCSGLPGQAGDEGADVLGMGPFESLVGDEEGVEMVERLEQSTSAFVGCSAR